MVVTSEQWRQDIQPQLRQIRSYSRLAAYYAGRALAAVEAISVMPQWLTIAESDLNEATERLIDASNKLKLKPREEM